MSDLRLAVNTHRPGQLAREFSTSSPCWEHTDQVTAWGHPSIPRNTYPDQLCLSSDLLHLRKPSTIPQAIIPLSYWSSPVIVQRLLTSVAAVPTLDTLTVKAPRLRSSDARSRLGDTSLTADFSPRVAAALCCRPTPPLPPPMSGEARPGAAFARSLNTI